MTRMSGTTSSARMEMAPDAKLIVVDPGVTTFTLQNAVDAAVSGRGDTILVLNGGQTVTETVTFNKTGIRVISQDYWLNPFARGEFVSVLADASFTNGPVATVTSPCTIQGLAFVSRDTGSTFFSGAAMLIGGLATASPFGVHIKNCRFPKWNLSNRIGLAIEGSSDVLVDECDFEGVGADFDSGIYVQGATQNLTVWRSHFRSCTYAIEHGAFAGGGPHCMYGENVCEDAKFLRTGSNNATGQIFGNYLEGATDTGSYDVTVDTANSLGLVFSGNHYAE